MQKWYEDIGLELRNLAISLIPFPAVGDERIAAEMAATVHVSELDIDVEYAGQAVALRNGRAVGTITVTAVNSAPPVDQLEALARLLDERMKEALEQASP